MKRYICREAGCDTLLDNPGYCEKHKREKENNRIPFKNAVRSNEGLYNTNRWKKLRAEHLKEQDYCVYCGSSKDLEVDHIMPPRGDEDLFYSSENLQTICGVCHRLKTAKEIRDRKRE
jgi:5-methylcytosine-specific restriction protein A